MRCALRLTGPHLRAGTVTAVSDSNGNVATANQHSSPATSVIQRHPSNDAAVTPGSGYIEETSTEIAAG